MYRFIMKTTHGCESVVDAFVSVSNVEVEHWVFSPIIESLIKRKAFKLAHSPGFSRSDQPDIEQEFRLLLWRKAAKYNANRAKRPTFAKRIIENKVRSMAREVGAAKRSYRRNSRSLNERVASRDGAISEFGDLLDASAGHRHLGHQTPTAHELASLRMDLADANRDLSSPQKELAALLSHVAKHPAGQVLGMSRRETAHYINELRELYTTRGLAG
jgi:hypothetical protein